MDVDYLRGNSRAREVVIFVDTSMRDKVAWPSPSEFAVDFDQPFRNVVSMNVLDATIPATMYVVDSHNDLLRGFARLSGSSEGLEDLRAALQEFQELRAVREIFADTATPEARLKVYDGIPDPESQGEGGVLGVFRNSAQVFPSAVEFSSLRVLGGGRIKPHQLVADSMTFCDPPGASSVFKGEDGVPRVALVIVTSLDEALVRTEGVLQFVAPYSLWNVEDDGYTFPAASTAYALSFDPGEGAFFLVSSTVAGVPPGAGGDHLHELSFFNARLEAGNYDAPGFAAAFAHAMPPDPARPLERKLISLESPSEVFLPDSADFMQYNRHIQFSCPYPFWFDMEASGLDEVLGFTELASDSEKERYSRLRFRDNRRIFGAVPVLSGQGALGDTSWVLRSPGLLNLNGVRFVIMKCPEIEDATPSASAHNLNAGVGLFKMYDQTLSHLRFDFVRFNKSDFHPIGKLSRLHLRFERLGGQLYDFKGADFHVLLVLRVLEPRRPVYSRRSGGGRGPGEGHLNPDYDPDVLRFVAETRDELDESDTASESSLLEDGAHRRRFLRRRQRMAGERGGAPGCADGARGAGAGAGGAGAARLSEGPSPRGGAGSWTEGYSDSGRGSSGAGSDTDSDSA